MNCLLSDSLHHKTVIGKNVQRIVSQCIFKNIRWRVQFGSMQPKEIPKISVDVVREALINSVCHIAYRIGQSNEVYKDRMEFYKPGSFSTGYIAQRILFPAEKD